jgi:hypothetical protein
MLERKEESAVTSLDLISSGPLWNGIVWVFVGMNGWILLLSPLHYVAPLQAAKNVSFQTTTSIPLYLMDGWDPRFKESY